MSDQPDPTSMPLRRAADVLAVAVAGGLLTLLAARVGLLYLWWVLAPGAAVIAVATGIRRHRPARLLPWLVLLGAISLLWVGWSMSAAIGAGLGGATLRSTLAGLRDAVYVVAYPSVGVAALLMVKARTGGQDRDNVIDASIVMVALATALGAWLLGDHEIAPTVGTLDRLWVTAAPLLLAAVVAASIRVLFAAGRRLPAAWLFFGSSVLVLAGNLWTSQLLRDGAPTQLPGIDVLWVIGFVLLGAAALDPSMRELTEPVPTDELLDRMPVDRLVLLGAALLAAPLAHLRVEGGTTESRAVVAGGVVVAGLVMWRVVRLLRERDVARQAFRAAAARDAAIARIGHWALDDRSTWQLLDDVEPLLARTLGDRPCAIARPGSTTDVPLAPGTQRFPLDDGVPPVAEIVVGAPPAGSERRGEREFLDAVASLLSSAIGRRAAEEQLRHDALHDPLTGLPNRSLALDRLHRLLARRDSPAVTVIFLDLDGFKAINDTFGHATGDQVLRDVAERLTACVRESDTVARFAGDEFVVLAPGTDPAALERLRSRLFAAATLQVTRDGRSVPVSTSIGIATGTADAERLVRDADAAMYRAKHAARAVAVPATSLEPPPAAGAELLR